MASSSSSPELIPSTGVTEAQPRFSYKNATHEEVLEDLSSRFILNLPDEELTSLERICFQVEQAHWFYEDFIREQNPNFPSLPLKKFSAMLFHACPLLHQWSHDHENAFNSFMQYKTRVPVCGAIMLNETWDKCVLVKGWKSSSGWGFPKGKINEDEPQHVCAIREVLEETGYNLVGKLNPDNAIELSIKEQKISLFVVSGVEEDFSFQTKTRKEISRIEWFRLVDLPTWKRNKQVPGKFYLISPFIGPLKAFINEHKPRTPRKISRQKKTAQKQLVQSVPAAVYASDVTATDGDNDIVQDSDSQSPANASRHDNNGTLKTMTTPATNEDLKTDNFDPHFARLMNSLTLSASANVATLVNPAKSPPAEPTTPIPSLLYRKLDPGPIPETYSQVSSVSKFPSEQSAALKASSIGHRRDPSMTPVSHQTHPLSPRHLSSRQPQGALRSPTQIQALSSSMAQATTSTTRRSTANADITPYLTKNSEVPSSARRLQQLALLETVADESARMLPKTRTNPGQHSLVAPAHSNLIPSTPPLPSVPLDVVHSHRVYYSSQPQNPLAGTAYDSPGLNTLPGNARSVDPLQACARISQGSQRALEQTSGSLSMSQSQLLALMNNRQAAPMQPHLQQTNRIFHPQHRQPYSYMYNPPLSPPIHGPTALQSHVTIRNMGPNSMLYEAAPPAPGRYASATPAVDSFPVRTAPNSTAQTLLSILNGGRPLQGNTTTTQTPASHPT